MSKTALAGGILLSLALAGGYACQSTDTGKNAPRRMISIKAEIVEMRAAKAKAQKGGGQAASAVVTGPIISTYEGEKATITIRTEIPDGPSTSGTTASKATTVESSVTVVPTIAEDGRVNISGSLAYKHGEFTAKDIKLSATLEPGKPLKLPAIVVRSEKRKDQIELVVTLTATVGRGEADAHERT